MSEDLLGQAITEWNKLALRVEAAPEIGWRGFKGLTWEVFTQGKNPAQTLYAVRALTSDFEQAEVEFRRNQEL